MAIAVDASSPAIVTGTAQGAVTTASFTPPNGSLVLAVAIAGWTDSGTTTIAMSDSLTGTWTSRVTQNTASDNSTTFGGCVQLSTRTGTGSAMTVTATPTFGSATGGGMHLGVFVITGASTSTFGAMASLSDTSSGNDLTASLTTTQIGSLVFGGFLENKGAGSRVMSASTNVTFTTGLSGTNPYSNSTDSVISAVAKASAATSTLSTNNYAVTWTSTAGVGKAALLEVLPGVANIAASDASSNIIDSGLVTATVPGAADTGSGADNATVQIELLGTDTGSGVDAAGKVTNLVADTASSTEATKVVANGATLAFASEDATAVDTATVRVPAADSVTSSEMSITAVQGRLNAGQRIVRVQAEDRTDYVVR